MKKKIIKSLEKKYKQKWVENRWSIISQSFIKQNQIYLTRAGQSKITSLGVEEHESLVQGEGVVVRGRMGMTVAWHGLDD